MILRRRCAARCTTCSLTALLLALSAPVALAAAGHDGGEGW